jgi:SAM-dependent methyltransferase
VVALVALPDDFRTESRRRWSDQAAGWEARRDELRTSLMPVSAWMIDAIDPQPGYTLLELAAGTGDTGLLAAELIQPGGILISSDFSPEMLQTAQRRAEELGVGNVRFKQIDADTSIDLEAASIDGVLVRFGYMLMAEPEHALRETRRVLRPGRRVALAAWAGPEGNPWSVLPRRTLVERGLEDAGPPATPHQFTWAERGAIEEALEQGGFTEYDVEALDFAITYRSAADWWAAQSDLSMRFATAVARAGDDDLAAAGDALDAQAEQFRAADGTLRVPARAWVAWAVA